MGAVAQRSATARLLLEHRCLDRARGPRQGARCRRPARARGLPVRQQLLRTRRGRHRGQQPRRAEGTREGRLHARGCPAPRLLARRRVARHGRLQQTARRMTHRSGFACFVGRPNAGKSTLTNALVGSKVAIMSDRPQTTRHAVRGIVHRPDAQLVLVDTPGFHKPRTLLGQRLNDVVRTTLAEVDVIAFCIPADEKVGPGDRYIAGELMRLGRRTPIVAVVTKTDLVSRDAIGAQLVAVSGLGEWDEIVPTSATDGFQVGLLSDLLSARLPEGEPLYPDGELTDEPERVMVAELVREAALAGVRDELPHSIAVVVEEMKAREGRADLVDIEAVMYVERESQKGIVIGTRGARLREVGTNARGQIEALLGSKVYLDLRVKVAKDWQRDPKQLRRLGF